jgi:hypothetical protein
LLDVALVPHAAAAAAMGAADSAPTMRRRRLGL